jgi:hypothetical protein
VPQNMDNDDGSSQYHTHDNVFIYADNGLKSNFGGNNNQHTENIYAYVGTCFYGNPCRSCATAAGVANATFTGNRCIFRNPNGYPSNCGAFTGPITVHSNTVYSANGSCEVCTTGEGGKEALPLEQWVAKGWAPRPPISL